MTPADKRAYDPLHLDWPDCRNVRDLGGMPTRDGATIRHGALIRSDSLDNLFDEAVEVVHAAGVSRIVDLRRVGESPRAHPFADDPLYVSVPVQNPADPDHGGHRDSANRTRRTASTESVVLDGVAGEPSLVRGEHDPGWCRWMPGRYGLCRSNRCAVLRSSG